jgi:WD40 repeat protein
VLLEARDAQHWLRACAFSPAGETFGVCSQDGSIYLYDTRGRTLRAKCAGFSNGPAMSLDFSEDGAYVQCDGGAGKGYEHLYFSGGDGISFSLPSQLKNVKWATWTCRLGWPMLGAWPQTSGGGYDRNLAEPTCCDRNKKGDLLAVGYEVSDYTDSWNH